MNPLLQQFVEETRDILENMGDALLALEERPNDDAVVDGLFRSVHTLKGNSGLFELPLLTRVVHAAEDVLDKVRDHALSIDADLTDELLASMDFIQRMMEQVEAQGSIPDTFIDEASARIESLRQRMPEISEDAIAYEDPAVDQVQPPEDMAWLAELGEEKLSSVFAEVSAAGILRGMRYIPEADCFFKGGDPLLTVRNLPGQVAALVRPARPWGETEKLDIYQCNLVIDALSTSARPALADHLRYVPEQVALYDLDVRSLAVPCGDWNVEVALVEPFIANARQQLENDDLASLSRAAGVALEMVGGDLAAASVIRWVRRFIDAGYRSADIVPLLDCLENRSMPVWEPTRDVQLIHNGVEDTAEEPVQSAPDPVATLDQLTADVFNGILKSQRELLELDIDPARWDGQIKSIGNALTNVFTSVGRTAALSTFSRLYQEVVRTREKLPLIIFLDDVVAADEPAIDPVPTASVLKPASDPRLDGGRYEADSPRQEVDPEERKTSGDGERAARVLKVPQEKVDRLMELIGEMVVAKNALPYLAARAEEVYGSRELAREIKSQFAVINRIAEDMQDGIMQVRMLPMGAVFQRFPRLVRDVAKQLGKKVRLVLDGEDAEADKHIVESLGDPLIHILRNSLDHGIEDPAIRAAAGKPEEGRINVKASQEGDRVIIEIEDDGKGIDPVVIKRKAFEKGIIDEAKLDTLSDHEAVQLVFAAGFSTAETISNLSGRGVGMDVVKTSLEKIGGQVRLVSEKGKGTKITLSLPLSVAVSNVLMINVGGQRYGVPMDVVVETVRVPEKEVHVIKDKKIAVLRGNIVPLFGSDELLCLDDAPVANSDGELAVLVARVGGTTVGIIVDGFAQTTDVILKPLDGPLRSLSGFAGSALLGDGNVLLVLDLKELL